MKRSQSANFYNFFFNNNTDLSWDTYFSNRQMPTREMRIQSFSFGPGFQLIYEALGSIVSNLFWLFATGSVHNFSRFLTPLSHFVMQKPYKFLRFIRNHWHPSPLLRTYFVHAPIHNFKKKLSKIGWPINFYEHKRVLGCVWNASLRIAPMGSTSDQKFFSLQKYHSLLGLSN